MADPCAKREVFILGDNHRAMLHRVPPNGIIPRVAQPCILHMLGLVPALLEQARKGGRKLGVNDPAHSGK